MIRRYFILQVPSVANVLLVLAFAATSFLACTSPTDLDTPRTVQVTAPHVPQPESLRVRSRSTTVEIFESDQSVWVASQSSVMYTTLDTTFHPPLYWCNGVSSADMNRMPASTVIRSVTFALDTMTAGVGGALHGNQIKIFAARKSSPSVKFDSLNVDSLSPHLVSAYNADARSMIDTIFFHIRSLGSGGDPGIDGKAIIRTSW